MELRFAQRARATKDLDIGIEGARASRLQTLSEVLKIGFDDLHIPSQSSDPGHGAGRYGSHPGGGAVQDPLLADHRSRSWTRQTRSHRSDRAQSPRLSGVGRSRHLPRPMLKTCPGPGRTKVARLHGAILVGARRDVLDIILVDALGELDYAETAEAARTIFSERATHDFPPDPKIPPGVGSGTRGLGERSWIPDQNRLSDSRAVPWNCDGLDLAPANRDE